MGGRTKRLVLIIWYLLEAHSARSRAIHTCPTCLPRKFQITEDVQCIGGNPGAGRGDKGHTRGWSMQEVTMESDGERGRWRRHSLCKRGGRSSAPADYSNAFPGLLYWGMELEIWISIGNLLFLSCYWPRNPHMPGLQFWWQPACVHPCTGGFWSSTLPNLWNQVSWGLEYSMGKGEDGGQLSHVACSPESHLVCWCSYLLVYSGPGPPVVLMFYFGFFLFLQV